MRVPVPGDRSGQVRTRRAKAVGSCGHALTTAGSKRQGVEVWCLQVVGKLQETQKSVC